jgi:hypothetical protein
MDEQTPGTPPTTEPPRFDVMNGYLVEHVGGCTCVGGGGWPHESHCGWHPHGPVEELLTQAIRGSEGAAEPRDAIHAEVSRLRAEVEKAHHVLGAKAMELLEANAEIERLRGELAVAEQRGAEKALREAAAVPGCREEATGYEDFDSADASADEHRREATP